MLPSKIKTTLIASFAVASIFQTGIAFATDAAFNDVLEGNVYFTSLQYLKEQGLVTGYEDGTFKPNQPINRAEAVKMLTKIIPFNAFSLVELPRASIEKITVSSTQPLIKSPFPDIQNDQWYFEPVVQAFTNKVISGFPDGKFRPTETINKAQAIKMAVLESGMPTTTEQETNFKDVTAEDWFFNYAKLAKQKTFVVADRQGNLNAGETLNRGDFALLLYRMLKNQQESSYFGRATYYATYLEGNGTSSGEAYNPEALTSAHLSLPFGTIVKVTNIANGKEVIVKINDRGPYPEGIVLDLSKTAFSQIASLSTGVINIEYQVVQ